MADTNPWDNPSTATDPWEQPTQQPLQTDPVPEAAAPHAALINRFGKWGQPDSSPSFLSNVFNAAVEGAKAGFGSEGLGLSPESQSFLIQHGIFPDPNGGSQPLRNFTEAITRPFAVLGDTFVRSYNAGVKGVSSAMGSVAGQVEGMMGKTESFAPVSNYKKEIAANGEVNYIPSPNGAVTVTRPVQYDESAARDTENLINSIMIDQMGRGGQALSMTKPALDKYGVPYDLNLGNVPASTDMTNTAKILGSIQYEDMIRQLYNEHGVLPAEVAHDAQYVPSIIGDIAAKQPVAAYGVVDPYFQALIKDASTKAHIEAGNPAIGTEVQFEVPNGLKFTGTIEGYGKALPGGQYDVNDIQIKASNGAQYAGPISTLKPVVPPVTPAAGAAANTVAVAAPTFTNQSAAQNDPSVAAVLDRLSVGDHNFKPGMTLSQMYNGIFDDLNPINKFVKDAVANGVPQPELGKNPYIIARVMRGINGGADDFLSYGTRDFATGVHNGESLQDILAPRGGEPVDLNLVRAYSTAKRAVELEGNGITTGIPLQEAQDVISKYADTYEPIHQRLVDYSNRLTAYLRDSGVLSEERYNAMISKNQEFVPFYAELPDEFNFGPTMGKGLVPNNPIKGIEGSELKKIDPLESIIKNTYSYLTIAEKNQVGQELGNIIDQSNAAGFPIGKQVTAFSGKNNTIAFYRNGVQAIYEVDNPDLLKAWQGLNKETASILSNILFTTPAKLLRAGITLDPAFAMKNLVRDLQTAFINTKNGVFSPIDTAKGFMHIVSRDQTFQDWLYSGGANAAVTSMDRMYLQENLFKLHQGTGFWNGVWNSVEYNNPISWLRSYSELVENSTRMGEFDKYMTKLAENNVPIDRYALKAAGFASRDITLDFSRAGSLIRPYNAISAFFNANLQDMDKIVQMFKERPGETTLKAMAGITIPSMLLYMHNHDDPRYQELPREVKDMYWIFPTDKWENATNDEYNSIDPKLRRVVDGQPQINNGPVIKIPRGFTMGFIFGAVPERIMQSYLEHDPRAFKGIMQDFAASALPGFLPTATQPMFEQWANKNTFTGQKLIPDTLLQQLPQYQYNDYTSETAKMLGRITGQLPAIENENIKGGYFSPVTNALSSPILIQNYLNDWTGGLGKYALAISDYGLKKAGVVPDNAPAQSLADNIFLRSFIARYPSGGSQSIQDFYDAQTSHKTVVDTLTAQLKSGNIQAVNDILGGNSDASNNIYTLDQINQALAQHQQLIHGIYQNPTMSPDEKRQLIDVYHYNMIKIAKLGVSLYDQIDAAMEQSKK